MNIAPETTALTAKQSVSAMLARFSESWLSGQTDPLTTLFHADSQLLSSQHGSATGAAAITQRLGQDSQHGPIYGQMTNRYVAIDGDQAAASCYVFGIMQRSGSDFFIFGATLVFRASLRAQTWSFDELRLQVNWNHGNNNFVPHWRQPPGQNGWQMGDEAPVIVSELHSPWTLLPNAPVPESLDEALAELYYRYAFSVDQNDMSLLAKSYSEDISGGFAPVGNLSGRDQVIGTLKSFRHLATLWQHFAEVVKFEDEGDGQHVKLIVARIIPERSIDQYGNKLYGAHYQLRARRQPSGQWQFCWTDYRPGWFSENELPAFDIGNATA
ncbi:nuclear transport factor 2 family protein [Shewanella avicenniae]|uniref:Nuclear transport factor 2 family protein n=1 Tax=Shewanella avicenniae TaxID=2814294 RepID=A0ABX7QPN8_9GAMM|nr:nuclear transport factor 2 family protein [Shewanella avicenniae]QSX32661.1 nuclear transport factor 2 family protein [Shewanella avicenniae]